MPYLNRDAARLLELRRLVFAEVGELGQRRRRAPVAARYGGGVLRRGKGVVNSVAKRAISLAARGWPVFPCGSKNARSARTASVMRRASRTRSRACSSHGRSR
jgi:hypothetical protein